MIPAKIQDVFIQITTTILGDIKSIDAGKFAEKEFKLQESIFNVCPFLEGTLEALSLKESFLLEGMLIISDAKEYNVDVELFKENKCVVVLIHNRTNVYKFVDQLNQNRNDIFFIKRELAEKNIELEKLRKIADKANEEKSRFLAMMSHEIRNPLNAILGYSEMISAEKISDNAKEYLNSLMLSNKNLKVIVDDILDLSRIEAGKLELVDTAINIREIVVNCIKNYQFQNKKTAVKLLFKLSDNLPNLVLGDDVRVNQILSNLVSNALKFTEEGEILLQANFISEDENTVNISFIITDSGRGMTEIQASKIFNEYQQNKKSDNRVFGGAGLGLSIVKRLLSAMNGTISVESELDKGTSFKVEIPFKKAENLESNKSLNLEQTTKVSLKGKRVLVADDDFLNQTIVAHILKKEDVILTQVKDGLEALNMLKTMIFDVVLLDIHMPNITGEELVQLKADFKTENKVIPFISLTANTSQEDLKRYKHIGFKEVISKPFTSVDFVDKISFVLG